MDARHPARVHRQRDALHRSSPAPSHVVPPRYPAPSGACAHPHSPYYGPWLEDQNDETEEVGGGTVKFRCDRDLLSEAMQTVQRGVSTRPGIPALTGVLMTVSEGELALTTTDLEVTTEI